VTPEAVVKRVNDDAALAAAVTDADLLLVNRQLDGMFSTYEGLDLIAQLRAEHPRLKCMMISNYPDALAAAEKLGCLPGFGKANQTTPEAKQRLRIALGIA
jgi:DNA-binding NarL/FixJ family response regulator